MQIEAEEQLDESRLTTSLCCLPRYKAGRNGGVAAPERQGWAVVAWPPDTPCYTAWFAASYYRQPGAPAFFAPAEGREKQKKQGRAPKNVL